MLPIRTSRTAAALIIVVSAAVAALAVVPTVRGAPPPPTDRPEFDDSHFHLTNYIQQGIDVRTFLQIMGTRVRRSTLFGIPLQQQWSFANSETFAPTYYLQSDAPLYYYSFTDAYIATAYRSLSAEERARFDPMITGFKSAGSCRRFPASSRASASSRSTRSSSPRKSPAKPPASRTRRSTASSTSRRRSGSSS